MKTKYGTKIVLVCAGSFVEFKNYVAKLPNKVQPPVFSEGVAYTKTHNYRYITEPSQMRGYRGVDVEFIGTVSDRINYQELKDLAEYARMK